MRARPPGRRTLPRRDHVEVTVGQRGRLRAPLHPAHREAGERGGFRCFGEHGRRRIETHGVAAALCESAREGAGPSAHVEHALAGDSDAHRARVVEERGRKPGAVARVIGGRAPEVDEERIVRSHGTMVAAGRARRMSRGAVLRSRWRPGDSPGIHVPHRERDVPAQPTACRSTCADAPTSAHVTALQCIAVVYVGEMPPRERNELFNVRLSDHELNMLRALAEYRGLSQSDIVRQLLRAEFWKEFPSKKNQR